MQMKFRLPSPLYEKHTRQLVTQQIKQEDEKVLRPSKKQILQLYQIGKAIEQRGMTEHLLKKKLPHNIGHGIFLHPHAAALRKGAVIGSYAGKIAVHPESFCGNFLYAFELFARMRLSKEQQAYFDPRNKFHTRRLYSLYINAYQVGNFTRFINHSQIPNVVAHFFRIPKNPYGITPSPLDILYVANKTIHPGEQLLVSYEGDDGSYWSSLGITPDPMKPGTYRIDDRLRLIHSLD